MKSAHPDHFTLSSGPKRRFNRGEDLRDAFNKYLYGKR